MFPVPTSTEKGILKLSPDLDPDKEKFEASYDGERQSLNIWPEVEDEKASVKVYAISGIKAGTVEKDETITGTKDNKDRLYWKIFFADQEKEAKVRLEVKSRGRDNQRLLYYPETYRYYSSGTKKKSVPAVSPRTLLLLSIKLPKREPVITR